MSARWWVGQLQLGAVEFDLSDLTDQTITTFVTRRLELAAHIAPGVPGRLVGDPLRLRQVLVAFLVRRCGVL